jgi:hypothetical protein
MKNISGEGLYPKVADDLTILFGDFEIELSDVEWTELCERLDALLAQASREGAIREINGVVKEWLAWSTNKKPGDFHNYLRERQTTLKKEGGAE